MLSYHDLDEKEAVERIQKGIVEYFEKSKKEKGIIGLSGGIDSSVTATLLQEAIGSENVLGVILPSKVTEERDISHAKKIAKMLEIEYCLIYIQKAIDSLLECVPKNYEINKIVAGNTAARTRMILLYNIAQMENGLVVGTGNKSEILTGYFTKYGDGGVDILPIGDLFKTEVREIAEYLEIPQEIIRKAPSAGLWSGQTDEEELGISYEELDKILHYWEIGRLDEIGIEENKKLYVLKLVEKSVHKRELPKIIEL